MPSGRRVGWALVGVVALGALLRVWGLSFGLPHALARPDETAALGHAADILGGDPNPHFFHWPSLHLYVLALLFAVDSAVRTLVGAGDATPTFAHYALLGRGYVALAGTLTIPVVFLMARRVSGPRVAVIAAAFMAVVPLHVRDSHFAMTDVPMTLLTTASLWLLLGATARLEATIDRKVHLRRPDGLWTMALAGAAGGLATSTKYNAAAVLAPAVAAQLWVARRAAGTWRVAVWVPLLLFALCFAAGFVAATPFAVLDFGQFRTDVLFNVTHLSGGHGPALGRGWWHHLRFSLLHGLGPLVLIAALAGIVVLVGRSVRDSLVIGSFVGAFYLTVGSGQTVFARYVMPLVPVACLLAALSVEQLGRGLVQRFGWREAPVLVLLAALVAAPSAISSVWLDVLLARTDTRVLAARWLAGRLPADTTLYESGREYVQLAIDSPQFHRWQFDPDTGHFAGASPDVLPQWIVLHRSPLAEYTPVPEPVERLVEERYDLVQTFTATTDQSHPSDYDQQDAFFLPLRRFRHVLRPGPSIFIYARRP